MDDSLFVGDAKGVREGGSHGEGPIGVQAPVADQKVPQAPALDVFHDDVGKAPSLAVGVRVEDGDDRGMGESAGRLCLAQEPLAVLALLVGRQTGWQQERFESHTAAHVRIAGQVDDAHRAAADLPFDLVSTDPGHASNIVSARVSAISPQNP